MFVRLAALTLALAFSGIASDNQSILAVFAHPDDETSVGPLLAKYAKEGNTVVLVTITSGQKGVTEHAKIKAGDALAAVREKELQCSAEKLGVEPMLLHFQDQGIEPPDVMEKVVARLREIFNTVKPDVVITWGPDGFSGHPDHRAASNITTQVFQQQGLLAHKPRKLYYVAFPESKFLKAPPPFDKPGAVRTVSDSFVTTTVNCKESLEQAWAAIQCHQSQWTPEEMKQIYSVGEMLLGGEVNLRLALSSDSSEISREEDILEGLQ